MVVADLNEDNRWNEVVNGFYCDVNGVEDAKVVAVHLLQTICRVVCGVTAKQKDLNGVVIKNSKVLYNLIENVIWNGMNFVEQNSTDNSAEMNMIYVIFGVNAGKVLAFVINNITVKKQTSKDFHA